MDKKKINLFLVRHGETEGMIKGIRLSASDPLSLQGLKQADFLAKRLQYLNFDYIYTSPTLRATQTVKVISEKYPKTNPIKLDDLAERKEASDFIGLTPDKMPWDFIKKHRLNRYWRYGDGESFDDIYKRASRVLDKMSDHPTGSKILAVSHGSFTRAVFAVVLLGPELTPRHYFDMTEKLTISATAVSELEFSQKNYEDSPSWKIISWMDKSHLEPSGR